MFFDLQADPGEMKNLAADKAAASELERHRQLLAQWKKTTEEDKYPVQAGSPGEGQEGETVAVGRACTPRALRLARTASPTDRTEVRRSR